MTDTTSSVTADFLRRILPNEGVKVWTSILKGGKVFNRFCTSIDELAGQILANDAKGIDTYHAIASFNTAQNRRADNALGAKVFMLDVDVGEGKPYATIEDAITAVDNFCKLVGIPIPGIVRSGGGIHVYWVLDRTLTKEEWLSAAKRLKLLAEAQGFELDSAFHSDDLASILRPPGTHNYKIPGQPRPVEVDDLELFEPIQTDEFIASVMAASAIRTPPPGITLNQSLTAGIPTSKAFDFTKGLKEGEGRNKALCQAYGELLAKGYAHDDAVKKCQEWNQLNVPPLQDDEFNKAITSITQAEERKRTEKKLLHENLKARAEALPADASHDVIKVLLQEMRGIDPLLQHELLKIIKRKTKTPMGKLQAAMAEGGGTREPDHLALAREVIDQTGEDNLLATVAHVWRWRNTGVWRTIAEREVKQLVQHALEQCGHKVTSGLVIAVTDVLKNKIFAKEHEWDRDRDAINFLNGELHWTGEAWERRDHSREHYRTTQIPHDYAPSAKCPRFKQFLDEIFQNDDDRKDKKTLILELIGYTLVSHAKFETFVLLIGSGANGKSVLLAVIEGMVGADNAAGVPPAQLNNKHQRAYLHLKLANLVTEIAEGAEIADAELKAITSGDLMTAEHKYQDPFSFRPFCTCWFGSNHLPHTRDFSDALFRRAKVIPFNRKFEHGVDADENLKGKLAAEMPGIINLALQAFSEVLKRGTFTEPESCKQAKQDWRFEADQVAQFLSDLCEVEPSASSTSYELYQKYHFWAETSGIVRKLAHKNFTKRIERLGGKPRKGTGGVRMIDGIRIKVMPPAVPTPAIKV